MQHGLYLAVLKLVNTLNLNELMPDQPAVWTQNNSKVKLLNRKSKFQLSKVLSSTCLVPFSSFAIASVGGEIICSFFICTLQ